MRDRQKRWIGHRYVIANLVLLFFCVALSAHAAEEGGNSATERANELFKWINFAIVAAVLIWLFAKKLPAVFRGNADKISSAITKATAAKEEAERQVREAEAKLANLQREIAALEATARREAIEEGERIRALAQNDAKKSWCRRSSRNRSSGARCASGTESAGGLAGRGRGGIASR